MRIKDGSNKNFEDRTGWWPTRESESAQTRLQSRMRQNATRREKKQEGLQDTWHKMNDRGNTPVPRIARKDGAKIERMNMRQKKK